MSRDIDVTLEDAKVGVGKKDVRETIFAHPGDFVENTIGRKLMNLSVCMPTPITIRAPKGAASIRFEHCQIVMGRINITFEVRRRNFVEIPNPGLLRRSDQLTVAVKTQALNLGHIRRVGDELLKVLH